MRIVTIGIVLREKAVGNEDRLVTILTRDRGVISAFARGAKKLRGGLCAATELFCYSRMTLFFYRDSCTLDSAEPEASFYDLRKDLTCLALASYIAELFGELAPHEEAADEYLRLLLNSLHLLQSHKKEPALIKAVVEMRLMTMAGFMPDLTGCSGCGVFEGQMRFSFENAALYCETCAPLAQDEMQAISLGVLSAMRHIVYSESERLFSFGLSSESTIALGELCERYLIYQVQRTFLSLRFYHSIT